jgi:hypothetical protein
VVGTELFGQFPFAFDLAHGRIKTVQEKGQLSLAGIGGW